MGAGDELGGQVLIDWSRHLRNQLWWLPHLAWSVMLVVLLGGAVWVNIATASAPAATKGNQAVRPRHRCNDAVLVVLNKSPARRGCLMTYTSSQHQA